MSESLAWVVGANCRRIRTRIGITQDDLARRARDLGLRWTASKVGDFESGRYAPTLATVFVVLLALDLSAKDAGGKSPAVGVRLADLLAGNGLVALTDTLDIPGDQLAGVCRGQPFSIRGSEVPPTVRHASSRDVQALVEGDVASIRHRSGVTEYRLSQRLRISPNLLAAKSFNLWGRTFSEERDRRAGSDANRQKRGQVSRVLQAELKKALADGDD